MLCVYCEYVLLTSLAKGFTLLMNSSHLDTTYIYTYMYKYIKCHSNLLLSILFISMATHLVQEEVSSSFTSIGYITRYS